jgi:toxin-antitoxin system PIN domain toxin
MTYLLDVNVLVALVDPLHVHHGPAHGWFAADGYQSWATCPITQNGALRIIGHSSYPNSPGSPAAVATVLAEFFKHAGHQFWTDEISLFDPTLVDITRLLAAKHVTDTYLLALARKRGGRLATFDRRLMTAAVTGGGDAISFIGAATGQSGQ